MDTIIDALMQPYSYGFMSRALAVSVLVGVMCPLIGAYIVTRNLAFMGDAMAHAILPGLVAGFLVGVTPFAGAVPAGIAVALLIGYIVRRTGVSEDTSIGILFAGLFALGLTMLTVAEGLPVDLEDIILGQVLGVSATDVVVTSVLAGVVVLVLYVLHKELLFSSFDPAGATVIGLRTDVLDYLLLVLIAMVIVLSVQAAGIVLVMAMLVTPAATAYLLVQRFVSMMAVGAVLGALSAVVGLYLSFHFNLPSGPAMTLVATALFVVVAVFRRRPLPA